MNARLGRRSMLLLAVSLPPLALASCSPTPPPATFTPLSYTYLPVLRLKVASIDVENNWQPEGGLEHLESLSPETPLAALRTMAKDRLAAGASSGKAVFTIENASITGTGSELRGNFAVRLTVTSGDGTKSGSIEARTTRTAPEPAGEGPELRAALYDLVRTMMNTMNVDFEYQLRKTLGSWLEENPSPTGTPVETEPLAAPGTAPGASGTTAATPSAAPVPLAPSGSAIPSASSSAVPNVAAPSNIAPQPGVLGTLPLPLHNPAAP